MPASAANDLKIDIRVAAHAADDGWHLLAALGLEALDQVPATGLVQGGVVAIVLGPKTAAGGINLLDRPAHYGA